MRVVFSWWVMLALTSMACAQASPQLQSRIGGLGEVTLDVVVRDKAGLPVSGLGPGDFVVTDNAQVIPSSRLWVAQESPKLVFVLDAVNSSYSVSYVEPRGTGKDTYHPVSVRLARDGRELRTRTGLYAR